MEMNMFGKNMQFGPVKGYSLSHLGIAIRNAEDRMVSYDKTKNEIVDVDLIDFNADNLVYAIPEAISKIAVGDVILHNGVPMFVKGRDATSLVVIDVENGEKKNILPTKSMFGFDFVTKIVSAIDFSATNASNEQPFGNLLPLLMMSNSKSSKMKDMLPMILLMGQDKEGFKFDMSNPLVLMAMMGGSEGKDFFPMMLMMQSMTKEKTCQCGCHKETVEQ